MAAANTDKFMEVGTPGTATTLASPGHIIAGTSITVVATTNWPTATGVAFAIDRAELVNGVETQIAGTYTEWIGTVASATSITNLTLSASSPNADQNYSAGSLTRVYIPVTATVQNKMAQGIVVEHNQDGTHDEALIQSRTADTAPASGDLILTSDVSASNALKKVTLADLFKTPPVTSGTMSATDWKEGVLPAQSGTIVNNGNRSYDIPFASTVAAILSPGMRLRTTRTVTAPTQCADLEASSSQYFTKTSPAGLSFTTTFTCMAWVKLESYTLGGIISRRNADTEGWSFEVLADGRINMVGLRIAGNNKGINSYQSIPLNKWVHVAATIDMTAGDTAAQIMWIDGVEVPRQYTLTGTASALVQGTTALNVGAQKSAGTNPFDGKIAQAAVFSSNLSTATVRSYMSQTLSGAESTNVGTFTLNNSLVDTSSNANTVTASGGALATATDSPFGQDSNGVTAGTTDYALVMKVSTTTATVQVPEGCTIPTSGGVSAVAYSTTTSPFGFTLDKGRWAVETNIKTSISTAFGGINTWYGATGQQIIVPVGAFNLGYQGMFHLNSTVAAVRDGNFTLSTTTPTAATKNQNLTSGIYGPGGSAVALAELSKYDNVSNSTATTYSMYAQISSSSGTETFLCRGDLAATLITAIPSGV